MDTIIKELKHIYIAFKIIEDDVKSSIGYENIRYHICYNVKIDFAPIYRLITREYTTEVTVIYQIILEWSHENRYRYQWQLQL